MPRARAIVRATRCRAVSILVLCIAARSRAQGIMRALVHFRATPFTYVTLRANHRVKVRVNVTPNKVVWKRLVDIELHKL